ncbi:MAG: hypothetical protein J6C46_05115 [Clostridia bacterium]|nr:hypothetical protein [Clostridia bacterium]
MNIISFPCVKVEFNYDSTIFSSLGFEFVDTGIEGSYLKLPEGWSADYQYHTPFEFFMIVTDNKRRLRANAIFIGQTAKFELLTRYSIINYKPWLSPFRSELRIVDNATNRLLYAKGYLPKLVPNKTSTDLEEPSFENTNFISYDDAYNDAINFCKEHNIDLTHNDPLKYW